MKFPLTIAELQKRKPDLDAAAVEAELARIFRAHKARMSKPKLTDSKRHDAYEKLHETVAKVSAQLSQLLACEDGLRPDALVLDDIDRHIAHEKLYETVAKANAHLAKLLRTDGGLDPLAWALAEAERASVGPSYSDVDQESLNDAISVATGSAMPELPIRGRLRVSRRANLQDDCPDIDIFDMAAAETTAVYVAKVAETLGRFEPCAKTAMILNRFEAWTKAAASEAKPKMGRPYDSRFATLVNELATVFEDEAGHDAATIRDADAGAIGKSSRPRGPFVNFVTAFFLDAQLKVTPGLAESIHTTLENRRVKAPSRSDRAKASRLMDQIDLWETSQANLPT